MEARRKSLKPEVNYVNPKKNNQFSPSPIKRYHKPSQYSQSTNLPSQKSHHQKLQSKVHSFNDMIPNNKENEGLAKNPSRQLIGKRVKKPLRDIYNEINNLAIPDHLSNHDLPVLNKQPVSELMFNQSIDQICSGVIPKQLSYDLKVECLESNVKVDAKVQQVKKREEKLKRKMEDPEQESVNDKIQNDSQNDLSRQEDNSRIGPQSQLNNYSQSNIHSPMNQENILSSLTQSRESAPLQPDSVTGSGKQYLGRWTDEEHQKFLDGLEMFGKDWRSIEEYIGSRSCAQIRSHAQKYFNKLNRDMARNHQKAQQDQKIQHPQRVKKTLRMKTIVQKPTPLKAEPNLAPVPIQGLPLVWHTNNQINQILGALQRHQSNDFVVKMKSLIADRESISKSYLIDHSISDSEAVQRLIPIADAFDQLAKEVLLAKQIDLCNRMINERNLSQLACITLATKIAVLPNPDQKRQVIQHVYHSTGSQTEDMQDESDRQVDIAMADSLDQQKSWIHQSDQDHQGILQQNEDLNDKKQ